MVVRTNLEVCRDYLAILCSQGCEAQTACIVVCMATAIRLITGSQGANMKGTILAGADLESANLRNANLTVDQHLD